MSDSDPDKKEGEQTLELPEKEKNTSVETDKDTSPTDRREIVAQAKKFLEADNVRNESTDKKIAFLESKSLRSEEIQQLLGVSRNLEATSPSSQQPASAVPQPSQNSTAQAQPSHQSSQPSQARDIPPIITYPEFLTTPQAPSPLVTRARLLTTLYLFSGLSALLYGTNTYLVTPMIAQLTTSRLSLLSSASQNLQTLISKLEPLVSVVPPARAIKDEEVDSEDEDPTELFHRDIGVQTSPPGSPTVKPKELNPAVEQTEKVERLSSSLAGLMEDSTSEGQETSDLSTTIGVLREYLDSLAYVPPSFTYGSAGYGYGATGAKEDDEIGRVKASIRSVKGVLLSARSFPGVRAGR
ncbi:peroxisomal membrane anchor protein conserved region-domain-containing protein [Bisporella sp. PMI_857]|nr:peroxisomal membrane anchor protein conserved region-domain-containing protein [Bisporella sp. PMI_857]